MSVTVFYQGRNGTSQWRLGKRWLLLPIIFAVLSVAIYQHTSELLQIQQIKVDHERMARQEQQDKLINLKGATESQLAMLVTHVAKMQARLTRLEALGHQVAKNNQLDDQFDFASEVGVGGVNDTLSNRIELDQLIQEMNQLVSRIDNNQSQLSILETVSNNLHIEDQRYISGQPIEKGWLSSPYGLRNDPFNGHRAMHKGIDFAGKEGSNVIATAGGVVVWAGKMFGYGELVEIDHGNGLRTRYGHNKSLLVTVGDVVTKGDSIAKMGSTGRSTGPHVHYEVLQNGKQIDPKKYVYRKAS